MQIRFSASERLSDRLFNSRRFQTPSVPISTGMRRVGDFGTNLPNKYRNLQRTIPALSEKNPALRAGPENISGAPRRGACVFLVLCPYLDRFRITTIRRQPTQG